MKINFPRSSRLAALATAAVLSVGAAKQAAAADLATTLSSNPQFSDFVLQLHAAGIWGMVTNAQNITIFAPTNAAVEQSHASVTGGTTDSWKTQLMDSHSTVATYGTGAFAYETALLGTVIKGVHPVSDFAGKAQPVHTLGTTVYWVDGRDGSQILVGNKAPSSGEMGVSAAAAHMTPLGAPIAADNGVIYPVSSALQ